MTEYLPLIYDLAIIAILLYSILMCARRGLIRSLVDLAGYFLVIWLGQFFSEKLAQMAYDTLLKQRVQSVLMERISESATGSELVTQIQAAFRALPPPLDTLVKNTDSQLFTRFENSVSDTLESIVDSVATGVVEPMAVGFLRIVFFLLIFAVGLFIVRRLSSLLGGVNYLPLIGPANRLLGGVLGLAEGIVTVLVLILVLNLILIISQGSAGFISEEIIGRTHLLRLFFVKHPLIQ